MQRPARLVFEWASAALVITAGWTQPHNNPASETVQHPLSAWDASRFARTMNSFPVAVGGIGGSGTRVGARYLQLLGFEIGDDLNDERDNLSFTLLFKHRSILVLPDEEFDELLTILVTRLQQLVPLTPKQMRLVQHCASVGRLQHDLLWLNERAKKFLAPYDPTPPLRWGWKEPNTHVVIERIFQRIPEIRYIHFYRNPFATAFGGNQNQLQNWGPVFLNRDVELGPRDSLAYWCAVDRRMLCIQAHYPDRVALINLDALCAEPFNNAVSFCRFSGVDPSSDLLERLVAEVSFTRAHRELPYDYFAFNSEDLDYLESRGFDVAQARVCT